MPLKGLLRLLRLRTAQAWSTLQHVIANDWSVTLPVIAEQGRIDCRVSSYRVEWGFKSLHLATRCRRVQSDELEISSGPLYKAHLDRLAMDSFISLNSWRGLASSSLPG